MAVDVRKYETMLSITTWDEEFLPSSSSYEELMVGIVVGGGYVVRLGGLFGGDGDTPATSGSVVGEVCDRSELYVSSMFLESSVYAGDSVFW